jgi:hypothetical protein
LLMGAMKEADVCDRLSVSGAASGRNRHCHCCPLAQPPSVDEWRGRGERQTDTRAFKCARLRFFLFLRVRCGLSVCRRLKSAKDSSSSSSSSGSGEAKGESRQGDG